MAKEDAKNEEEQENEVPPPPMFSKMGLIVLGAVIVLFSTALAAMVMFMQPSSMIPENQKEERSNKTTEDIKGLKIDLSGKESVQVSVPVNELGTDMKYFRIGLTIIVGRVKGEDDPDFKLIQTLEKEGFREVTEEIKEWITDIVITSASNYTYDQLNKSSYREEFRTNIKKSINELLIEHNLKPRINKILFKEFTYSDF